MFTWCQRHALREHKSKWGCEPYYVIKQQIVQSAHVLGELPDTARDQRPGTYRVGRQGH